MQALDNNSIDDNCYLCQLPLIGSSKGQASEEAAYGHLFDAPRTYQIMSATTPAAGALRVVHGVHFPCLLKNFEDQKDPGMVDRCGTCQQVVAIPKDSQLAQELQGHSIKNAAFAQKYPQIARLHVAKCQKFSRCFTAGLSVTLIALMLFANMRLSSYIAKRFPCIAVLGYIDALSTITALVRLYLTLYASVQIFRLAQRVEPYIFSSSHKLALHVSYLISDFRKRS